MDEGVTKNVDPPQRAPQASHPPISTQHFVLAIDKETLIQKPGNSLSLVELISIIWRKKRAILWSFLISALASVAYALLATEWYRAEVLLAPADQKTSQSISGQLGGLVALAGLDITGAGSAEAVATLNSRELARGFIEEFNLLQIIFADEWDDTRNRWRSEDATTWPTVHDAVKFFHEDMLRVSQDHETGLVAFSIDWIQPDVAAQWANELVDRLNQKLRERALREAETNARYLQSELAQSTIVTLQQSIGRLLENELQRLMLARGNEEFAFRVIDPAVAPIDPIRPKRALIVVLGTFFGILFGVGYSLSTHLVRSIRNDPA